MRSNLIKRLIACWLTVSFLFLQIAPANAGMIGTQAIINQNAAQVDRDHLKNILHRETARELLAAHGVTVKQAQERIDALTNAEVSQLAAHFDKQPAGGFIIEAVIIAALVVVILELVGITDIFTGF